MMFTDISPREAEFKSEIDEIELFQDRDKNGNLKKPLRFSELGYIFKSNEEDCFENGDYLVIGNSKSDHTSYAVIKLFDSIEKANEFIKEFEQMKEDLAKIKSVINI